MKLLTYTLSVLLLIAFASCKQTDSNKSKNEIDIIPDIELIEKEDEKSAQDEELQEFGIIENIEDGGYPYFVVTVNFPKQEMKIDFNLNIEAISLNQEDLNDLTGKYSNIHYTSQLENRLSDIQLNGTSLLGEYAPEFDDEWKQITGVLSGADEATAGDLADIMSITDSQGQKIDFEWFIDSEIVSVNGKVVDAFYYIQGVNTITQIIPEG